MWFRQTEHIRGHMWHRYSVYACFMLYIVEILPLLYLILSGHFHANNMPGPGFHTPYVAVFFVFNPTTFHSSSCTTLGKWAVMYLCVRGIDFACFYDSISDITLPEHLSSPPVFSGVRVTRSLVLYVCFVDRCLSFCTFSFGHCVVCSSSIYGFWLPLWYLQTLLNWSDSMVFFVFVYFIYTTHMFVPFVDVDCIVYTI